MRFDAYFVIKESFLCLCARLCVGDKVKAFVYGRLRLVGPIEDFGYRLRLKYYGVVSVSK